MASSGSQTGTDKLLLAAVEGGGTSFRVVVCETTCGATDSLHGTEEPRIIVQDEFDSSHDNTPQQTLHQCADFFEKHKPLNGSGYASLGIAIFGPVGVHEDQPETYGTILSSSPKANWRNVDFLTPLRQACQGSKGQPLPVIVETDVNAPALAEYMKATESTKGSGTTGITGDTISSASYITVGTGVGVGLVVNGQTVHGRMHPEGGHVPVQPLEGDPFKGYSWGEQCSPFHGRNTVEGIASSVALTERLLQRQQKKDAVSETINSAKGRSILADIEDDDDELFDHAANALANLCATLLLMLSMEKIVLGGGLMKRKGLLDKIRNRTVTLINGYLELPSDMSSLITTSSFGNDAGIHGAIVLAQQALRRHAQRQEEWKRKTTSTGNGPSSSQESERRMKQEAFGTGVWHGIILGAVATAAIFKWWLPGGSRRR